MIHWPRVKQLRHEVGADEFDEVVQIFLDEVAEVIARLPRETENRQMEQNLHFLKGSALSLGFELFSKLCQDGERRAAAGDGKDVDIRQIITSFDQSKAVFDAELKQNLG
ncbi:MAG: Hpt domain-containing protein [Ruegeria sp.]